MSEGGASNEIDVTIMPDQFRTMAAKCNPNTAVSPSGFGYVTWRANGRSELGAQFFSRMMSLPFGKGLLYKDGRNALK